MSFLDPARGRIEPCFEGNGWHFGLWMVLARTDYKSAREIKGKSKISWSISYRYPTPDGVSGVHEAIFDAAANLEELRRLLE